MKTPRFMMKAANSSDYSMNVEQPVSIEHFTLKCINDANEEETCDSISWGDTTQIAGGRLFKNVPQVLENADNIRHTYVRAVMGQVQIYYVGILNIVDTNGNSNAYVYYTTDEHITNKTVYAVLKEDEKISLEYSHSNDYVINYKLEDSNGNEVSAITDNWTMDAVFGDNRVHSVRKNGKFNGTVQIPRGYSAEVSIINAGDNSSLYTKKLGEMMEY